MDERLFLLNSHAHRAIASEDLGTWSNCNTEGRSLLVISRKYSCGLLSFCNTEELFANSGHWLCIPGEKLCPSVNRFNAAVLTALVYNIRVVTIPASTFADNLVNKPFESNLFCTCRRVNPTTEVSPNLVQKRARFRDAERLASSAVRFHNSLQGTSCDLRSGSGAPGHSLTEISHAIVSDLQRHIRIRFDSRRGLAQISACGNRAGRWRWSAGFLGELPFPPPLHSSAASYTQLTSSSFVSLDLDVKSRPNLSTPSLHSKARYLICPVQRYDGNTAHLARRSDEALGVRVSVARIAPSPLDLGRGGPSHGACLKNCRPITTVCHENSFNSWRATLIEGFRVRSPFGLLIATLAKWKRLHLSFQLTVDPAASLSLSRILIICNVFPGIRSFLFLALCEYRDPADEMWLVRCSSPGTAEVIRRESAAQWDGKLGDQLGMVRASRRRKRDVSLRYFWHLDPEDGNRCQLNPRNTRSSFYKTCQVAPTLPARKSFEEYIIARAQRINLFAPNKLRPIRRNFFLGVIWLLHVMIYLLLIGRAASWRVRLRELIGGTTFPPYWLACEAISLVSAFAADSNDCSTSVFVATLRPRYLERTSRMLISGNSVIAPSTLAKRCGFHFGALRGPTGLGDAAGSALASHQRESCSIPGEVAPKFWHVGIVKNNSAGRWVFSGTSRFFPTLAFRRYSHFTLPSPVRCLNKIFRMSERCCIQHFGGRYQNNQLEGEVKRFGRLLTSRSSEQMSVIEVNVEQRRPTASSGTIPTCENPVTRPGIEPGSPWWEASVNNILPEGAFDYSSVSWRSWNHSQRLRRVVEKGTILEGFDGLSKRHLSSKTLKSDRWWLANDIPNMLLSSDAILVACSGKLGGVRGISGYSTPLLLLILCRQCRGSSRNKRLFHPFIVTYSVPPMSGKVPKRPFTGKNSLIAHGFLAGHSARQGHIMTLCGLPHPAGQRLEKKKTVLRKSVLLVTLLKQGFQKCSVYREQPIRRVNRDRNGHNDRRSPAASKRAQGESATVMCVCARGSVCLCVSPPLQQHLPVRTGDCDRERGIRARAVPPPPSSCKKKKTNKSAIPVHVAHPRRRRLLLSRAGKDATPFRSRASIVSDRRCDIRQRRVTDAASRPATEDKVEVSCLCPPLQQYQWCVATVFPLAIFLLVLATPDTLTVLCNVYYWLAVGQ
ncbi:hypothetical protein PR048_032180 [Dryococelus australis]|uniref:Uncharacterized protein n=1 Tax=Dryococelus australis TaxID=614101 RepID=A0ABQ9G4I1_9NEOP|nr:hypothetical protein PR048_032180 [Dryococelus australis]